MSRKKNKVILARSEQAPALSENTLRQIKALGMFCLPGSVNQIGIFHEWVCVDAIKAGAKKCICTPEVRLIKGVEGGKVVELHHQN